MIEPIATTTANDESRVVRILSAADEARESGRRGDAIEGYLTAATIEPTSTYAHYWLATCYEEAGRLELARLHCETAIACDPSHVGFWLRMASICVSAGAHNSALEFYLRAAAIDPDIPDIDAMIADACCVIGDVERGIGYFDRALQRNPSSVRLQSNRLFVRNYVSGTKPADLFAEHRQWGELHESMLRS